MTTENWTFEELDLERESAISDEEYACIRGKRQLLDEMLMERYSQGDFGSETVEFLENKKEAIYACEDTLFAIKQYLNRLKDGYPFHVPISVGRYMKRFGLTKEQSELFRDVHRKHMKSMGTENQKKYASYAICSVVWSDEENCLHVHYDDIWWHYTKEYTWY